MTENEQQIKELLVLCRTGRLDDIRKWIEAGKSLEVRSPRQRRTLLQLAVETGFYSLVELIAKAEHIQESRNSALADAVRMKRLDLVQVLLAHGAEIKSVDLADALLTWEPTIIRFFLDNGVDPLRDMPFAIAFDANSSYRLH